MRPLTQARINGSRNRLGFGAASVYTKPHMLRIARWFLEEIGIEHPVTAVLNALTRDHRVSENTIKLVY
jgi:hypothetical protein